MGAGEIALVAALLLSFTLAAHPLHTSMTEVVSNRSGTIELSLRVFADDFTRAAAEHWRRHGRTGAGNAPLADYAAHSLAIADQSGQPIATAFCGIRTAGDMLWICLRTQAPRRDSGFQIVNRVLFEVFDDQINVVRAKHDGRTISLLFTPGDLPATVR